MSKVDKREEAKILYIRENKEIKEISKLIGIPESTIYRWKKEDGDWDEKRSLWNLSPMELEKTYIELVKELVMRIRDNKELMLDSEIAHTMSKHIANIKKLRPASFVYGIGLDLLVIIDNVLREHNKELREEIVKYYDVIKEELKRYSEQ